MDFDVQHRDWSESLAAMREAGGADLIAFVLCYSPPGGLVGDPFIVHALVTSEAALELAGLAEVIR